MWQLRCKVDAGNLGSSANLADVKNCRRTWFIRHKVPCQGGGKRGQQLGQKMLVVEVLYSFSSVACQQSPACHLPVCCDQNSINSIIRPLEKIALIWTPDGRLPWDVHRVQKGA